MKKIYDIIGIGIGPFNLGLAVLCASIPELNCLFIDANDCFNWHPGLLLPEASLQVPFYADLATLADPMSAFTYMAFLKAHKRLFRFAIHEHYFVTRREYNHYCQWVAGQLPSLRFGCSCEGIRYDEEEKIYEVKTATGDLHAKHIVIGTGTVPSIPEFANEINHPFIKHSSDYLFVKEQMLKKKSVSIVGSGQSAAEIYYDLLQSYNGECHWFTRSSRFFPMEYSKLTLEMTSPDYIDHFYSLGSGIKQKILSEQGSLYKGINFSLINTIYDTMYSKHLDGELSFHLHPNCVLKKIYPKKSPALIFHHREKQETFLHKTDAIILATGYKQHKPAFLEGIKSHIQWTRDELYNLNRNYSVDNNNTIFVQNADLHTHGFNSADLGMGPYRNAIILNTIVGYEHYKMESNMAFQEFGLPKKSTLR